MSQAHSALARAGRVAFIGHVALLTLSGVAFATFLAPPSAAWLDTPTNRRVAALMFQYGGQTTVVLGAIAAFAHAWRRLGASRAGLLFGAAFGISLGAELLGTTTGYPFGPYGYTTQLGYLIGGRVPFNIPTSWFFMLYASLAITSRIRPMRESEWGRITWAMTAAVVLTAWDVSMDPAMVSTTHWLWHLPHSATPGWTERLFLSDLFYGMPLSNWLGWLLTGFVIARVLLAIVPQQEWKANVSATGFPFALYAINGVFPLLICAGRQMWGAVGLGGIAMAVPLALALGRRRRVSAELSVATAHAGD